MRYTMGNLLDKAREEINEADRAIAAAFEHRMTAVRSVAQYKRKTGKPIFDPAREAQVIERGTALISDEELRPYYAALLADMMRVSREYQHRALAVSDTIRVGTASGGYDIILRRGALREVGSLLKLDRKVMIVTDDGVPAEYTRAVAEASRTPTVLCLPQGEDSKRIPVWQSVLSKMLESGFTRSDCVVAVGGGVVGDLSGFAASAYMRGIDFYNIPTTLLSQIDSGIGGKTGVDMDGVKNCVGAFWQPRCVIIDPNVLSTLDPRQLRCGLAEAVKMAACFDSELLDEIVLNGGEDIDRIIHDSLMIKRSVVEQDERESGLRRALNFGHTLGHGIEAASGGALLHGECVALGMLPMSAGTAKEKIISALHAVGLDTMLSITPKLRGEILDAVSHDKKSASGGIRIITVDEPGRYGESIETAERLGERLDRTFAVQT